MTNNKLAGDIGEQQVVDLVPCPNCGKKLMLLPTAYPMVDVQCTGCVFRAQIKTNKSKPKNEIFGAGWDITDKVLKSGYMMPPLIANYVWKEKGIEKHRIIFYPFLPKATLRKRTISSGGREGYRMFNYVGLDKLPHFVLYDK